MMDWVEEVHSRAGVAPPELYNRAVALAGHSQLAAKHDLKMCLQIEGFERPLPDHTGPFMHEEGKDARVAGIELTPTNTNWLDWLESNRGTTKETAIHQGLRILGSLATMPAAHIVIPDLDESQSFVFAMDLSGAPPLAEFIWHRS